MVFQFLSSYRKSLRACSSFIPLVSSLGVVLVPRVSFFVRRWFLIGERALVFTPSTPFFLRLRESYPYCQTPIICYSYVFSANVVAPFTPPRDFLIVHVLALRYKIVPICGGSFNQSIPSDLDSSIVLGPPLPTSLDVLYNLDVVTSHFSVFRTLFFPISRPQSRLFGLFSRLRSVSSPSFQNISHRFLGEDINLVSLVLTREFSIILIERVFSCGEVPYFFSPF